MVRDPSIVSPCSLAGPLFIFIRATPSTTPKDGNTLDRQGDDGVVGCKERAAWPSGGRTARPLDWNQRDGSKTTVWKGMDQDGCRLEVDGGIVLRREMGQKSHNAAGARGNFGWHCADNINKQARKSQDAYQLAQESSPSSGPTGSKTSAPTTSMRRY